MTVVILESDLIRRTLVSDTLRTIGTGVDVTFAATPKEAVRLLREEPDTLVVTNTTEVSLSDRSDFGSKRVLHYEQHFNPASLISDIQDRRQSLREITTKGFDYTRRQKKLDLFLGVSPAITFIRDHARRLAEQNINVLITGETGVGKSFLAALIHGASPRNHKPFRTFSCPGVPETLFDSELCGHKRGAFTGAVTDRVGRIESANGGTLLLDEISEIPVSCQAKLLDFLQHGRVTRLGSNEEVVVDVRTIATTNANLQRAIQRGTFRADVFYRLKQSGIHIPPLRDRREDIPVLAEAFLVRASNTMQRPFTFGGRTLAWLTKRQLAGNVRQLSDAVEQACYSATTDVLLLKHFHDLS